MRVWTKSACVVLAWGIVMIIIVAVTAGVIRPDRPPRADDHTPSNTSTTSTTVVTAVTTAAGTPATAPPAPQYVVQPGDTLSGIAARLAVRGGWPALYAANRQVIGRDPALIRPGTVLVLPGRGAVRARYTVTAGDTLSGIAAALAVRGGWQALYAANRRAVGRDPGLIRPGTVLAIPRQGAPPAPRYRPGSRRRPEPPPGRAAGTSPRPGRAAGPGRGHQSPVAGMPSWLTAMLLAAGLIAGAAFAAEPVLLIRRRHRRAATAAAAAAAATMTAAATGTGAPRPALVPAQVPRPRAPAGHPAGPTRVIAADYPRVVVTYSQADHAVYVLRPPDQDPAAVLRAARLVLPEGPYRDLARHLGLPASWPIVMADYDRVVVTCSARDGTICVLRPPGHDPAAVLTAARLVLPEEPYQELAEQLGVPPSPQGSRWK